jgi:hypothetical protein
MLPRKGATRGTLKKKREKVTKCLGEYVEYVKYVKYVK